VTVDTLGRAFDLYRRSATSRSAIALLIANAIPLVGVLFFGWSLFTILVLFWIENGIVGFWNVPRILLARQSLVESLPDLVRDAGFDKAESAEAGALLEASLRQAQAQGGLTIQGSANGRPIDASALVLGRFAGIGAALLAVFFLIHYGIFWLVHGIFVFALPTFFGAANTGCLGADTIPGFGLDPAFEGLGGCATPFGDVVWSNVTIAAVALFLSHGASFLLNYIGGREYLTTSPARQMAAPYGRVVVLHLTIIFGAMLVAILGAPIAALVVLIVLKTAFDLRLHLREHRGGVGPISVGRFRGSA
jgi:Family of unknown function (DUF6498)